MLLQHGTPHDHETNAGDTALTLACTRGHVPTVGALLQHGAYVDKETKLGLTPLIAAVEHDQAEVISALAACGAQLDYETERNPRSALTAAAGGNRVSAIAALVRAGALVDLQVTDG
jgi:ankyrin repeat protein